jgi:ABC-type phosphate/phosphonate transport system substrate-binding protein
MYDLPELAAATDAFWAGVAERLQAAGAIDVPAILWRDGDLYDDQWCHPDLMVSQACGYPVATELRDRVAVVGAFRYRGITDECAHYRSHLVVPAGTEDRALAGRTVVVNGLDSLSGWISLRTAVPEHGPVTVTGAHVRSLAALQAGEAELAAIDAVTWALLRQERPAALAGLAVVGQGPLIPAPPVIAHVTLGPGVEALRAALADANAERLLIEGFVPLGAADYAPLASW